jgi:hypothetical protein
MLLPATGLSATGLGAGFKGGITDALGPHFGPGRPVRHPGRNPAGNDLTTAILRWNRIAIDATGLDHTPPAAGETRVFGEQLGPCRSSRAIAIVHIAMFNAITVIAGPRRPGRADFHTASLAAAVAQAAHDTLIRLFPSQTTDMDSLLAEDVAVANDARALNLGLAVGKSCASTIMTARTNDGSQIPEPRVGTGYITSNDPGRWRQDPISQGPLALGAYWPGVTPFLLRSADQFRAPAPPALDSAEYALAYNEAQRLGGDGIATPTQRTAEQTVIGTFWAYDGTPSLCAPPRLYNQVATTLAAQRRTQGVALARLLTLVNVNMADAAIAIWDSKFYYDYWRPITGIRESDAGTGPSGLGDGNAATVGDPGFTPLGAPASNLTGPNFTPPFPSYPSGHAGFGGALFQTLRRFYGTDQIAFTFQSDEYNGITADRTGAVRPLLSRSWPTLSSAEEENGQSRIYLGIHWQFDKTEAITLGRKVADYNFDHAVPIALPG